MGYQNLLRANEYKEGLALMTNAEFPFASTPAALTLPLAAGALALSGVRNVCVPYM
jgi:hypothetical protein